MLTKDFYFELPAELIAQEPSTVRGQDRLMLLGRVDGSIMHRRMEDLVDFIKPGTLMVFNNSKVRRARCFAQKISVSGSKNHALSQESTRSIEFLLCERVSQSDDDVQLWRAMVKSAKKQVPTNTYRFEDGTIGTIVASAKDVGTEFRTLSFSRPNGKTYLDEDWFEVNGHMPLPPYIKRGDTQDDIERYQNVYADSVGSAACPTAGLHFTQDMLVALKKRSIEMVYITLHVGLGTFLPIRAESLEDHTMHKEVFTIGEDVARAVHRAKKDGRPILAVGTTSVRALESAWDCEHGQLKTGTQSTDIFLYPGSTFYVVNQLFTNFHTPESTLLMLVCAFAGKKAIDLAYTEAVNNEYRFFSYGDALFIH